MTGFTTGPILGDIPQQVQPATIPFGAAEGQEPVELLQQEARGLQRFQATYGTYDPTTGTEIAPPEPKISAEDAQARYGIGDLKFTDPVPESVAQQLHDTKQAEIDRQFVANYSPGGFWNGAARFGAGFALNALDPNNVAASFIPVVGEARYARWMMDAGSAVGRTAVRAGVGAAQGAVGQIPLTALHYGLSRDEQADYSAGDAMLDIAYGSILGGGLHATLGPLFDGFPKAERDRLASADLPTREGALRTAISQLDTDRSVDVTPVFAATSLRDRLMSSTALTPADLTEAATMDAPRFGDTLRDAAQGAPQVPPMDVPKAPTPEDALAKVRDEAATLEASIFGAPREAAPVAPAAPAEGGPPTPEAVQAATEAPSPAARVINALDENQIGATPAAVAAYLGIPEPEAAKILNEISRRPDAPVEPVRPRRTPAEKAEGKEPDLMTMRWRKVSPDRREQRIRAHESWAHKTFGFQRADFPNDAAYVDAMSRGLDRLRVEQIHQELIERAHEHGIAEPEKMAPSDLVAEVAERDAIAHEGNADRLEHEIDAIGGPKPQGYDEIPWDFANERAAEAPAQPGEASGTPGRAGEPGHPARPEEGAGRPPEGTAGGGGPEAGGRAGPRTELTPQGEQLIIPGAEQSARQAAASREAAGHGRMATPPGQRAADEGLFAQHVTTEDRNLLDLLNAEEDRAKALAKGFTQAAGCIARGLE